MMRSILLVFCLVSCFQGLAEAKKQDNGVKHKILVFNRRRISETKLYRDFMQKANNCDIFIEQARLKGEKIKGKDADQVMEEAYEYGLKSGAFMRQVFEKIAIDIAQKSSLTLVALDGIVFMAEECEYEFEDVSQLVIEEMNREYKQFDFDFS